MPNRILDWHANAAVSLRDAIAALGFIPEFVLADDPRPAAEQFAERYIGGWEPAVPAAMNNGRGWTLNQDHYLFYPGDPPLAPLAHAYHGAELILVYSHAWVAIVQPDGAFEVARID